jgi:serine beta-lactamase-like protein LACTB, mitochondrial
MSKRLITSFAISSLLAAGASAQSPALSLSSRQQRRIDSAVTAYMSQRHVPGASVAVSIDGRLAYAQGYGMADIEHAVRVTPRTRFQGASTLKTLTATAVLQLVAARRIDLDAPIQRYCSAFPIKQWPVSARELLGHQGGVRPSRGADVFNRTHYAAVNDVVLHLAGDSLVAEPGTRIVYSNEGYALLACAIEGASGKSYQDYLRESVLTPAGMSSTVEDDFYALIPDRSRSYIVRTPENTKLWEGLWTPAHLAATKLNEPAMADPVDESWEPGAGNYLTTPTDLVRFAIALQSGLLISDSLRAQEFTNQPLRDGAPSGRGWAWLFSTVDAAPAVQLIGSNWTGSSAIMIVPSWNVAVALSSNLEFEQPAGLIADLARIASGKALASGVKP